MDYLAIMDNLCIQAQSPTDTISFLHKIIIESYATPIDHSAALVAALAQLDAHSGDRVLIMLPDSPGFAEAFAGTVKRGIVPLPVDPLLPASDISTIAAEAGARLVLVSADRLPALAELEAEAPVLIDGPHGHWAAALRLRRKV